MYLNRFAIYFIKRSGMKGEVVSVHVGYHLTFNTSNKDLVKYVASGMTYLSV